MTQREYMDKVADDVLAAYDAGGRDAARVALVIHLNELLHERMLASLN